MLGVFSLIAILLFSLPAYAGGGGWSSSGGGSGIACFSSAQQAQLAEEFIRRGQLISDELLADSRINVLERWELEASGQVIADFKKASAEEIFEQTLRNVEFSFPLFGQRLRQVAALIPLATWLDLSETASKKLERIKDVTPFRPIPENCRLIQIVARFSNGNNLSGEGPTIRAPELRVVFSRKYFDRLPSLDQAMLLVHEDLYLLGQAVGHPSSDMIRGFNRIFFLHSWQNSRFRMEPFLIDPTTYELKLNLIRFFGDYIGYFSEDHPPEPGQAYTSQHHFHAFFRLNQRLRAKMGECRATGLNSDTCKERIMNPLVLAGKLSPEEAFVYFADFGLEQSVGGFNADYVMNPNIEDPAVFAAAMEYACSKMENFFKPEIGTASALSYCADWRAHYSAHGNKSN